MTDGAVKGTSLGLAVAVAVLAYEPLAPAVAPKLTLLLLVALGAVALAAPRLLRRSAEATSVSTVSAPLVVWLLLCGWSALSLSWASIPGSEAVGLWLAAAGIAVVLGAHERASAKFTAQLTATLIGSASASAALGAALLGARAGALHGGHGNPNWLGLVIACNLPLHAELAWQLRRRGSRAQWPAMLALLPCVVALILAASRTAWVALFVAVLIFARGRWRLPIAVLSAGGLALAWLMDTPLQALRGRLWIWRGTLDVAVDSLPLGCGHGGFADAFLDAQGARLLELGHEQAATSFVNATTAHGDWLQLLAEAGPLALVLGVLALLLAALELHHSWRAAAATVVVVAVCALADAPLRLAGVVAPLLMIFASCKRLRPRPGDRAVLLLLLLGLIVSLPGACLRWLTRHRISVAQHEDPPTRGASLRRAAVASPRSGRAALALGLALLEMGEPRTAQVHLQRSRKLLANLGTDLAIGNAQLMLGQTRAAIASYRRALRRHPAFFRAHANLAEALRQAGRLDQAERHLALAQELQPHHPKLQQIAERLRRDRIKATTSEH